MKWPFHRFEAGRSARIELMDRPSAERRELEAAYAELERLNRWLGGHATSVFGIDRLAAKTDRGRPLRILDVGTGGGEIAPVIASWAERSGRRFELVGIDDDQAAILYARNRYGMPRVNFEHADLFETSSRDRFDIVHMGITLHHFDDDAAVRALRRMSELASLGVVINDLQRHRVPFFLVQLVTAALRSPAYVKHDAPLSVNRAFTRLELLELARAAGWTRVEVAWRPMFRWLMIGG